MIDTTHSPAPAEAPPHPFRASPWYDPTVEHQPCLCPECEAVRRKKSRPWVLGVKTALVVCGGVILPIVSVVINHVLGQDGERVVQLGAVGTVAIIVSILTTLAHLVLSPVRRDLETGLLVHEPPPTTAMRTLLFVGALLGCLTWGYLSVLFLPLLPISVIAIVFVGFGLCGLCPYGALAIHVIQAARGYRGLRARFSRGPVLALLALTLALPILTMAGVGVANHLNRARLDARINAVADTAPNSVARMEALARLRGLEGHLVDRYLLADEQEEMALLAEAHLRLTDDPIHGAVQARFARGNRSLIRPWWFLDGGSPLQETHFWRF